MKYIIFLLVAALFALAAGKILLVQATPPPRIIRDMADAPVSRTASPPQGLVPFAPGGAAPEPLPAQGESLFALYCAACHGADGAGKSYVASRPGMPEVSNLTTTDSSEEELLNTLTNGRGAMPAFCTRLPESARQALLHYIRSLHHP